MCLIFNMNKIYNIHIVIKSIFLVHKYNKCINIIYFMSDFRREHLQRDIERQQQQLDNLQKQLVELPDVPNKLGPLTVSTPLNTFTFNYTGYSIIYAIINDDTCAIIGTTLVTGDINLDVSYATDPSSKSRRVVAVYDGAFNGITNIKTVVLPECLSIGYQAFKNSGLTEITSNSFPKCLTIGDFAFQSCGTLKEVKFPKCIIIGYGAFDICGDLEEVEFPKCITIGEYAFNSCSALEKIEFPSCTTIGGYAFLDCDSLKEAKFPKCIIIGGNAFRLCDALKKVEFPSCTTIGNNAFSRCGDLEKVKFPKCTTIGSLAFYLCDELKEVEFPKCVTIGDYAFEGCALKCVTIPCTIRYIGNDAFSGNPLERVNFEGSYDITTGSSPFLSYDDSNIQSTVLRVRIPDMCNVKKYANVLQLDKDIFRPLKNCCKC